ncbi:LPP20 family lipoprotein [Shewanella sp. NIFS-20-20]|uniref:LPP20 family lipoprotein n=1 Tax=Shewanella sp. NIFS-20-20 TaxID=2853806 RepID=UPI001C4542CB|nr:LPP20 family lipoprotein [Shewanella sp. NIFS-20-20]MBV7314765.1 LPP20 family lipoprotein [Shewanella sp. NIFS-20-20]
MKRVQISYALKLLLLSGVMVLSGCANNDRYVQWETEAPPSFPVLTATGYAPLAQTGSKNSAEQMLMAMQASKIAAYRELAEQVYGQQLQANSQVSDWMLAQDDVKVSVEGMIRGAKVVRSYPAGEHYVTEVEMDFAMVWQLYQQQNRPQRVKSVTYF